MKRTDIYQLFDRIAALFPFFEKKKEDELVITSWLTIFCRTGTTVEDATKKLIEYAAVNTHEPTPADLCRGGVLPQQSRGGTYEDAAVIEQLSACEAYIYVPRIPGTDDTTAAKTMAHWDGSAWRIDGGILDGYLYARPGE